MGLLKLQVFILCILSSSASEIVSKDEYDQEIRKIYDKLEKLDQLQYELDETRKENKALNDDIQILRKENQRFQEAIVSLENKYRSLESDMDKLRKERIGVNSQENIHSSLDLKRENKPNAEFIIVTEQEHIPEFASEAKLDYKDNRHLSSSFEKIRRGIVPTNQNNIGFLAYNSNDQQNLGIHQTLEFPTALTNVGSAYSTLHSIFRAPVDGLYFFSVTILSFRGEDMEVEIVHNGNGMAYAYSGGESMHGSGSTSAVLNLHANDDVWIRILDNKAVNDGNIRVHGYKWSSFCGFKIV